MLKKLQHSKNIKKLDRKELKCRGGKENITLNGGGENTTYFIGLGYLDQQGVLAQN